MAEVEYVDNEGLLCPYCDSKNITVGPLDVEADTALGEAECLSCGKEWTDVYRLVGYNGSDD